MTDTRTSCTKCNNPISTRTAGKNGGLCAICLRYSKLPSNWQDIQPLPSDSIQFNIKPDTSSIREGDEVAWDVVEDILVDLVSQYLRLFAKANIGKQFYGVAFDCNAGYAQVFLCANSPLGLVDRAAECKRESPHLWLDLSSTELEDHLRWSLGDWDFNAITTEAFSKSWEPVADVLTDAIDGNADGGIQQFREEFLTTACRAMLRLEVNGAFDLISQTDDFKTFVADHDEADEDSWARYDAVRQSQNRR